MGIFHEVAVESMLIRMDSLNISLVSSKSSQMFLDFILHDLLRPQPYPGCKYQSPAPVWEPVPKRQCEASISNCFNSIIFIPTGFACLITERILPKIWRSTARPRSSSSPGMGFISLHLVRFRQALIHLQNGNDSLLLPQVIRSRHSPFSRSQYFRMIRYMV